MTTYGEQSDQENIRRAKELDQGTTEQAASVIGHPLTGRQLEHLIVLSDNQPLKPYRLSRTSGSVFSALQRKGLADCIPTSPLKWRINDAGRKALEQANAGSVR